MIKEEYKNGCRLKEQVKYNIDYDDCQILNLTCANYIYDLVQESSKYETKLEDIKKMLYMIEKLLGHEVQYDIPEYHGDNKKCYFGVVSDNLPINASSTFKYFVYNSQTKKLNYRYGDNLYTINSTIITENNQRLSLSNIDKGTMYFDTAINKPIFWDGSKWIDATGATV